METDSIVRITMPVVGIGLMIISFWLLSAKKIMADVAVIWEIAGILLVMNGIIYQWPEKVTKRLETDGILITFVGMLSVVLYYLLSVLISRLVMRNHELAIETSLLIQRENDKIGKERNKNLLIILPVKNEEKNIQKVLEQLAKQEVNEVADVLCINDDSTDASGEIIDSYPCMQITNVFGLGYGSALKLGYKYAVRNGYEYVIQMDADGQHDTCNIPAIYQKLQEKDADGKTPDIVLASRFMEGSSEFPVSIWRRFAYWLFHSMIRMATGRKIADPTTGLQGLGRDAFTYYSGYNHFDYRYPDANMIMQMLLLQFRLEEIPAVMHVRTDGKSMHSGFEPVRYMACMFFSVLAVAFRMKVLKADRTT